MTKNEQKTNEQSQQNEQMNQSANELKILTLKSYYNRIFDG